MQVGVLSSSVLFIKHHQVVGRSFLPNPRALPPPTHTKQFTLFDMWQQSDKSIDFTYKYLLSKEGIKLFFFSSIYRLCICVCLSYCSKRETAFVRRISCFESKKTFYLFIYYIFSQIGAEMCHMSEIHNLQNFKNDSIKAMFTFACTDV